jgi:hypothetical protein
MSPDNTSYSIGQHVICHYVGQNGYPDDASPHDPSPDEASPDKASPGQSVPRTLRPQDDASPWGRTIHPRIISQNEQNVPISFFCLGLKNNIYIQYIIHYIL